MIRMSDAKIDLISGNSDLIIDHVVACAEPVGNFDFEIAVRLGSWHLQAGYAPTCFSIFKISAKHLDAFGTVRTRNNVGRPE